MNVKKVIPHLVAVILMLVLAVGVFAPTVFDNKVLQQHDNLQARGMQGEINPFLKAEGRVPLWTNQVFVGMPTYQLVSPSQGNWIAHVGYYILRAAQPIDSPVMMLLLMMGMLYVGLLLLDIDAKVSGLAALSFGLMTSNILFIEAGHSVKMYALAFVAPMITSVAAAYRGRWLLGAGAFGFFLALNLAANHVQITYYAFFVIGILGLGYLIQSMREKKLGYFLKTSVALGVMAVFAVGTSASLLWTTYEYAAESTRGTSELASKSFQSGLDKEYALGLSFEKKEAITLMVPFFYGGSQTQNDAFVGKGKKTETQKYFNKAGSNPKTAEQLNSLGGVLNRAVAGYWGSQTIVGGPVYYGAALCLLFFVGLFMVRGVLKWGMALSMGLLIALAWGKFFPLTDFFFDYVPMYNKFRDVKMTLLVGQLVVLIMGALALKELLHFDIKKHEGSLSAKILKGMGRKVSAANLVLLGGGSAAMVCLFALMFSFMGTPATPYDGDIARVVPDLLTAVYADRVALMRTDAVISLFIILMPTALLWWIARQIEGRGVAEEMPIGEQQAAQPAVATAMSQWILVGGLFIFIAVDLLRVDTHYLDKESFKTKKETREVPSTPEDEALAKLDEGKPAHERHYRVLDYRFGAPSQNAMGGYKHKIIGGYHAAKPRLFQELVEAYPAMDNNPNAFLTNNRQIPEMLNVRYVLTGQGAPLPLNACGNAWLVNKVEVVADADAALKALATLDPRSMAVVQKQDEARVAGLPAAVDSSASIQLVEYHPEKMRYTYQSAVECFAVFSEMYYPNAKGWNVYMDGQPVADGFVKTNFLLRGMRLPAGKHEIDMRFEPKSFATGEMIAMISSIVILLGFGAGLVLGLRRKKE